VVLVQSGAKVAVSTCSLRAVLHRWLWISGGLAAGAGVLELSAVREAPPTSRASAWAFWRAACGRGGVAAAAGASFADLGATAAQISPGPRALFRCATGHRKLYRVGARLLRRSEPDPKLPRAIRSRSAASCYPVAGDRPSAGRLLVRCWPVDAVAGGLCPCSVALLINHPSRSRSVVGD